MEEIHKVLNIKDCVGYDFIRVGKDNDGRYLMINDFNNSNIAYSFGICDDVSWDESIIDIAKKKKKTLMSLCMIIQ